jgi:hypothetical protein
MMARTLASIRSWPRSGKLIFVLIAAWSPLLLSRSPLLAEFLVALAAGLFCLSVSTASRGQSADSARGASP